MKFRLDKKYLHWGITGFLVLASAILFYYFLFHTDKFFGIIKSAFNVCMPIICGLIMAYLLTPICTFFERKILYPLYHAFHLDTEKVKTKKRIRTLAILLTMFLTLYLLYIFFSIVLKEVVTSIQSITLQSSIYVSNLERLMENILASNKNIEKLVTDLINTYSDELDNWLNNSVLPRINVILKEVSLSVLGVAKGLWNLIIGLIISIYVLASKETFTGQAKKFTYALFPEESANGIISDFRYANRTFGAYISGKIIDSIIIGILCYIFMRIFSLPYEILVSVIVGVTNIIPFFGPFLGGIPSALLIIMVNPLSGLKFIILILILQQFDGNILGPKILGDSTGLSSFWVIFSITIFGAYFGVLGMAIGVPVFALIYAAIKRKLNSTLKNKGLTTDTREYMHLEKIEGHQMIQMTEEKRRDARKNTNSPSISDKISKSLKKMKKSDTLHHDEDLKG
ncbi:MAG: AI-2E family transporter [Lachnospiraceae bacterium]|nr:AI-2E family transporter [Lachnospiraceae bacterium]